MKDSFDIVIGKFVDKGVFFHPDLGIRECAEGYGIFAKEAIPANTELARYPLGMIYDKNKYLEYILKYMDMSDADPHIDDDDDDGTLWSSYMMLIKNNITVYVNDIILSEEDYIRKHYPAISKYVDAEESCIREYVNNHPEHSYEKVKRAKCLCATRLWNSGCLLGLDVFNHNMRKGNQIKLNDDHFTLYTKLDINPDEQVYISYGKYDVVNLCLKYGFVNEDDDNCISFDVEYHPNSSLDYAIARSYGDLGYNLELENNQLCAKNVEVIYNDFASMSAMHTFNLANMQNWDEYHNGANIVMIIDCLINKLNNIFENLYIEDELHKRIPMLYKAYMIKKDIIANNLKCLRYTKSFIELYTHSSSLLQK